MSDTHESIEFRNARVLDGTGRPAFEASVRVASGRIERVGDTPTGADRVVDLDGSYLAPGFVDMHAHSDLRLFSVPGAPEKLTQGITTEVLGQDGVSVAPVPDHLREEWAARIQSLDGTREEPWPWNGVGGYLDALAAADPAVNAVYYAPHGNLRSMVAGFEDRPLTDEELAAVGDHLRRAIEGGAVALSTGMIYPPSSYGRDPELVDLAEVLAEYDAPMVSHVWNETDHVVESIERYMDVCDRGGCHAHVSHLKVGGQSNWGKSREIRSLFDAAERAGFRVTFDQYPYTAGSTMLTALLPPWARQGDTGEIVERLRDPDTVDDIDADIAYRQLGDFEEQTIPRAEWENLAHAAGTWDNILITRTASGAHEGQTLDEIATERETGAVEAMCALLVEEELDVTMVDFVMAEDDVRRFLADERGTFCTDGIFGGKPHPRAIGAFGRIVERYVHDEGVLTPGAFARKAAGHPADILGLPDRGYLREGYVADLVAFDPANVVERATYGDPVQFTEGFEFVLVGGQVAVEDGDPTEVRNGTVVRSTAAWDGCERPDLDRRDPAVRSREPVGP